MRLYIYFKKRYTKQKYGDCGSASYQSPRKYLIKDILRVILALTIVIMNLDIDLSDPLALEFIARVLFVPLMILGLVCIGCLMGGMHWLFTNMDD